MRNVGECAAKLALTQKQRAADKNIKLEVVVGSFAVRGSKDAAFAATVTAAKDNRFQDVRGNHLANVFGEPTAPFFQALFEFGAAVNCEALRHFKVGQICSVSFRYASIWSTICGSS